MIESKSAKTIYNTIFLRKYSEKNKVKNVFMYL